MKKIKSLFIMLTLSLCLIFTACGSPTKFELNFIVDEEVYSTLTTAGNETIELPENPTKEGFIFDGWYWDVDVWKNPFTASSLLNTPLSSNMKVYAKWANDTTPKNTQANFKNFTKIDEKHYSISVSNATSVLDMSDVVEISNTSSWYLATDIYANNKIESKVAPLELGDNIYYVLVKAQNEEVKLYTLTIKRRQMFNVYFKLPSVDPNYNYSHFYLTTVEEDSLVSKPENTPFHEGYLFNYWNYDFNTPITHNTYIYPDVTPNKYKIFYHYGITTIEQDVTYGSSHQLKNNSTFSKDYYNLDKWNTKEDGTGTSYNTSAYLTFRNVSNLDLYAKWTPIDYTITYHTSGFYNSNTMNTYNIETYYYIKELSKTGYTFDGWYLDSEYKNKITYIDNMHGDIHLYSKMHLTNYQVVYHLDGGINNIENKETFTYEDSRFRLKNPTKAGFEFKGWYTDSEFKTSISEINTKGLKNVDVFAKWSLIIYSVNYQLYNGINNTLNPATYTVLQNVSLQEPFKVDYLFDGWYEDENFNTEVKTLDVVNPKNITVYAKWKECGNDFIEIDSAEKLKHLQGVATKGNYILTKNIDLNNYEWTPIGVDYQNPYIGHFNGNGYIISNFKINTVRGYAGLFGYTLNAIIENLGVENLNINFSNNQPSESAYVGAIVGYMKDGILKNTYSTGNLNVSTKSSLSCGGLVGVLFGGKIENSYSTCNTTAIGLFVSAGGLVADVYKNTETEKESIVTNCFATGNVSSVGSSIYGSITASDRAGGLIGNIVGTCNIMNNYRLESQIINEGDKTSLPGSTIGTKANIDTILNYVYENWNDEIWELNLVNYPKLKNI